MAITLRKERAYITQEKWCKLIYPGVPTDNRFLISTFGSLKNGRTGKLYKPDLLKSGYYSVHTTLGTRADRKHILLHKAVAYTFIENPNHYPCVNHIDGNKTNNIVENLEWCTYHTNLKHAYDTGLFDIEKVSQESNHCAKLTAISVAQIRQMYVGNGGKYSAAELANIFGVSKQTVLSALHNLTWVDPTYEDFLNTKIIRI